MNVLIAIISFGSFIALLIWAIIKQRKNNLRYFSNQKIQIKTETILETKKNCTKKTEVGSAKTNIKRGSSGKSKYIPHSRIFSRSK